MHPANGEEAVFGIAFCIMMYKDVEQFERLLRAVYRPQNIYCVHVEASSSGRTPRGSFRDRQLLHERLPADAANPCCLGQVFRPGARAALHEGAVAAGQELEILHEPDGAGVAAQEQLGTRAHLQGFQRVQQRRGPSPPVSGSLVAPFLHFL